LNLSYIKINQKYWDSPYRTGQDKEAVVWHELAHCAYGVTDHVDYEISYMNEYLPATDLDTARVNFIKEMKEFLNEVGM
jgi:hypothetical protein